jgi:putative N-acetylmannosamine-6-phosphate epimerase
MRPSRWAGAKGRLIVSCQASEGDAFHGPGLMARFARAAVEGGAGGIRAHGSEDVKEIRTAVEVPVLGIHKERMEDGAILITPTFERAQALADAGADAIALDCTARGARFGAIQRLERIKRQLHLPVLADIATIEEAERAAAAGADFVLSTMRGFTDETRHLAARFEPDFIAELVRRLPVPVIAEGRIGSPGQAREAMEAGAWAVVVGTAITRPHELARAYSRAVASAGMPAWAVAIDIGATNIKSGLVSASGAVEGAVSAPTSREGPEALLSQLRAILRDWLCTARRPIEVVAVATAGWVDAESGSILHATGNLDNWSGAGVRAALSDETQLPILVDNDGVCAAAGEWLYGAARGARNALCITLGTGIGAGAIVEGRLLRGAHGLANMVGHIPLPGSTRPCNCGLIGCLEAETSALAGLIAPTPPALEKYARLLAEGLVPAIHVLDPEIVVLAGGVAAANPSLVELVGSEVGSRTLAWRRRQTVFRLSSEGQNAGVRGAMAMAALRCRQDS